MESLHARIGRFRRRLMGVRLAAGTFWGLAAAAAMLLLGAWLDLLWELPSEWRVAAVWIAGLGGAMLLAVLAAAACRAARGVARPGGWIGPRRPAAESSPAGSSSRDVGTGAQPPAPLSAGLATLAAADAARAAGQVPLGRAAPGGRCGGCWRRSLCWRPSWPCWRSVCRAWRGPNGTDSPPLCRHPPVLADQVRGHAGRQVRRRLRQRTWRSAPRSAAPRSNRSSWCSPRAAARSRRCRCFPRPTAAGGPC